MLALRWITKSSTIRVSYVLAQVIPAVHPGLEDGRVRRKSHSQSDDIKKNPAANQIPASETHHSRDLIRQSADNQLCSGTFE